MAPSKNRYCKGYGKLILVLRSDSAYELDLMHPCLDTDNYASTTHVLTEETWKYLLNCKRIPNAIEEIEKEKAEYTGNEVKLIARMVFPCYAQNEETLEKSRIDSLELYNYHGKHAVRVNWTKEKSENVQGNRALVLKGIEEKKNLATVDRECYIRWNAEQVTKKIEAQKQEIDQLNGCLEKKRENVVLLETRSEEIFDESEEAEDRLKLAQEKNMDLRRLVKAKTAKADELELSIQNKARSGDVTSMELETEFHEEEESQVEVTESEEREMDSGESVGRLDAAIAKLNGEVSHGLDIIDQLSQQLAAVNKDVDSENEKSELLIYEINECQNKKKKENSNTSNLKKQLADKKSTVQSDKMKLEHYKNSLMKQKSEALKAAKLQQLLALKSELENKKKSNDALKESVKEAREKYKNLRQSMKKALEEADAMYPNDKN